tara:strand:+ start:507 stop:716 length:210 start_codon:yes stop_codon:yes gene_type:complete
MSDTLWLHLDLKATNIIWTFMAKSQLGRCLNANHISSRITVAIDKQETRANIKKMAVRHLLRDSKKSLF